MNLETSPGGSPDTPRTKEFGKCAGCALIATCPTGPNAGGGKQLVVLTIAGEPAEKCENFVAEDAPLPGEQRPAAEGAEQTLQ